MLLTLGFFVKAIQNKTTTTTKKTLTKSEFLGFLSICRRMQNSAALKTTLPYIMPLILQFQRVLTASFMYERKKREGEKKGERVFLMYSRHQSLIRYAV